MSRVNEASDDCATLCEPAVRDAMRVLAELYELQTRLTHVKHHLDPRASNDDALNADVIQTKLVFVERDYKSVFEGMGKVIKDGGSKASRLTWQRLGTHLNDAISDANTHLAESAAWWTTYAAGSEERTRKIASLRRAEAESQQSAPARAASKSDGGGEPARDDDDDEDSDGELFAKQAPQPG